MMPLPVGIVLVLILLFVGVFWLGYLFAAREFSKDIGRARERALFWIKAYNQLRTGKDNDQR